MALTPFTLGDMYRPLYKVCDPKIVDFKSLVHSQSKETVMATAKEMIAMLGTLDPETQLYVWTGGCCEDTTCFSNYTEASLLRVIRDEREYYAFDQDLRWRAPYEATIKTIKREY